MGSVRQAVMTGFECLGLTREKFQFVLKKIRTLGRTNEADADLWCWISNENTSNNPTAVSTDALGIQGNEKIEKMGSIMQVWGVEKSTFSKRGCTLVNTHHNYTRQQAKVC